MVSRSHKNAAAPDSGRSSFTSRHGMLKFIKKNWEYRV